MKNIFRYIASFLVGAMTLAACQQEITPLGSEISIDPATLSVAGQNAEDQTVTVTSDGDWLAVAPEWITVTPSYGTGNATVTLSFADNLDEDKTLAAARTAKVLFSVAEKSVELVVEQAGDPDKAPAEIKQITIAEFLKLPQDDPTMYQIEGVVEGIYNTEYGNFYLTDETGTVLVYGLLTADLKAKEFASLGIDNGDRLVCRSAINVYNGTPQAKNAVYVSHEKSLISVTKVLPEVLPIEGGELMVTIACKGDDFEVAIPEDAAWLKEASKEKSGELAVVVLTADPNEGGDRSTEVEFVTAYKGTDYKAVITVNQRGAIIEATAAEINAAADGSTLYKITGYISSVANEEFGNLYIKDATGEVYVYGTLDAEGNTKNFASLGIKAGDIVTVVGPKTSYKDKPQMANVTVEKHVAVEDKTVEEFIAASESKDVYYRLTGAVSGMDKAGTYGNVTITDETGSVYVYGVISGWGGAKQKFEELVAETGLKEGDILTVVGVRSAYNGTAQVGSAFYVSHEEAPEEPVVPSDYTLDGKQWLAELEGRMFLFDFGLAEEEMLTIAVPNMDETEFVVYMAGAYEIAPAEDGTSGVITFTQYDWEWDELLDPIEFTYSELGENSVKISAETIFAVSDPVAFTLLDELCEITPPDGGGDGPQGAIADGDYWFTNGGKVMAPLAENEISGILPAQDLIDGASTAKNIFTFTYNPDNSYYTIQDSYGRYLGQTDESGEISVIEELPSDETADLYYWCVESAYGDAIDVYNAAYYFDISYTEAGWALVDGGYENVETLPVLVPADNPVEEQPETPEGKTLTLTNEEICKAMTSSSTSYADYTIESASGTWTVNASQNNKNTFLQCRGKKGAYIKTPLFEEEIKSVTIYFSEAKSVYANNVYCAFPSTWTAPTADAAYPEDGNVGRAVTDGSYSLTIPVNAGNKQVYISIIGTYAYYLDHIDVTF